MTAKQPFKFKTELNDFGDTKVYICKGARKVWLFNIVDGKIDITVPPNPAKLRQLGLVPNEDGWITVITR